MSETVKTKKHKKNVATQTHSIDTMMEIARLQEQVKLLTIENEHLRRYTVEEPANSLKPVTPVTPVTSPYDFNKTPKRTRSTQKSLTTPSSLKKNGKVPVRGCTCKGKCSSKMCGCVKRDIQCGEFCKCNNVVCRNQAHKDLDQEKENLKNIESTQKGVKNKKTGNKHLANVTVCRNVFSPDIAKDDVDLNMEELRASSLYFGSPKQLTFGLDKEDKEEEVKEKRNKKLTKHDKNEQKNVTKRIARPKKVNSEVNNMEKVKDVSSEEEQKQDNKKTNSSSNSTEANTTAKMKEIEKRIDNYAKNIANGMVSLRRGQKGPKQAPVKTAKENIISDSNSKEETSPVHEKENPENKTSNNSNSFEQIEMNSQETFSDGNRSNTTNEDESNDFNPMKPKYELSRTPVNELSVSRNTSNISVPPYSIVTEEDHQVPEEFNQAEVDWEDYQSRLVACGKCKRKFHPLRVKKHESCCKKL